MGRSAEALKRLIMRTGAAMPAILTSISEIRQAQVPQVMQAIQQNLQIPLSLSAMPLQDYRLGGVHGGCDHQVFALRFRPPSVGGPIEIAAISTHEGFRWVKKKFYFSREMNPEEKFTRVFQPEDKEIKKHPAGDNEGVRRNMSEFKTEAPITIESTATFDVGVNHSALPNPLAVTEDHGSTSYTAPTLNLVVKPDVPQVKTEPKEDLGFGKHIPEAVAVIRDFTRG